MRTIDQKLVRDLLRLKGQVLTIALVVACGIATYVTMRSTWSSLAISKDTYFEHYRFADVFAKLKRAPESLARRVEEIPGVAAVYTRVVMPVTVPLESLSEAASGILVSLPGDEAPLLNDVYLRSGRMPIPGRADEAVAVEAFANAHDFVPGDELPVVINGKLRQVRIVGIGLSPEFVFLASVGDFVPDDKQTTVLWMDRDVLAPAFQMSGAFNDLNLDLQPGASQEEVLRQLDLLLAPYGGFGAVGREKQLSNFILDGELAQLENMATVVPVIFLAVAAFLLNIVLGRLVFLQRQQIAALKALGYGNASITAHYLKLALVIVGSGSLVGAALGAWLGGAMTELYTQYFRFPTLVFRVAPADAIIGISITMAAGFVGAFLSVRDALRMSPAEAMRPASPALYRRSLLDRLGAQRLIGVSSLMVLREIQRRPIRVLLSSVGIAAAVGIMVVGRFGTDSMTNLIDVLFHLEQRGDATVMFLEPKPVGVEHEFELLPGVLDAEGVRMVPVRLRSGPRWRDSVINGMPASPRLRFLINRNGDEIDVPTKGIVLSRKLGEILHLRAGATVEVQLLEGNRERLHLLVSDLVDDAIGLQGYMNIEQLHSVMGQEQTVSAVQLKIDPEQSDELRRRLKAMPSIAQVTMKRDVVERFENQSQKSMVAMTLILSVFGAIIAIGVVYNNARVALSMRSRDLSSLRVLGFTKKEISNILLGELAVQVIIGIPAGLWLGNYWCHALMAQNDPETYRLAIVVSNQSYAFATAIAVGAAVVSALLVRRKLDRLDLIEVLKTRE